MSTELPAVALDHVLLSGDVWYSYPATPEPFGSVELADTVHGDVVCQLALEPLTVGTVGGVPSIRTVLPSTGEDGAQDETCPRMSFARNWTSVSPSADTLTDEPAVAGDQLEPPSVAVRYW